jgi:hypothetical protein
MPLICGPKNSMMTFTGSPCPHTELAFKTSELHLADAIREYEKVFYVSIEPFIGTSCDQHEPHDKYFLHTNLENGESVLVDLHIIRNNEQICTKHNLDIQLTPEDIVNLGELIC